MNQVLSAGDEIIEYILLARQVASFVPGISVFATTTEIGDHINATLVQPDAPHRSDEMRSFTDCVTAVGVQQSWIRAVELGSFAADDVQRHSGAVLGSSEPADHFRVIELDRRSFDQGGA